MEKILTIVIPTYNMQDYLRRCLDSLIVPEEQMQRLEVLVVNDGSKDNSSAIAHEYQDKYPDTFRVVDKENGNYGSCVNRGLKEATGKYIKILDADDWFDNIEFGKYLTVLSKLQYEIDMIVTSYTLQYASDKTSEKKKPVEVEYLKIYDFASFSFPAHHSSHMLVMHAITYRTELLRSNNYQQDTGISYTDMEYDMVPMLYVNKLLFVDINLYQYFLGREGQTVSQGVSSKNLKAYLKIYKTLSLKYTDILNLKQDFRTDNARVVLLNLLTSLFCIALYYETKTEKINSELQCIYRFAEKKDPILLKKLRGIKSYYILPIFYIWEKFGLFCSSVYLHKIIDFVVWIKKKVL